MTKIDRKNEFFLFRWTKIIGWTLTAVALLIIIIGAATLAVSVVDIIQNKFTVYQNDLTNIQNAIQDFNNNNSSSDIGTVIGQANSIKTQTTGLVNTVLDDAYGITAKVKTIIAGIALLLIFRAATNVLLIFRAISDKKNTELKSTGFMIYRFVHHGIVIAVLFGLFVTHLVFMDKMVVGTVNSILDIVNVAMNGSSSKEGFDGIMTSMINTLDEIQKSGTAPSQAVQDQLNAQAQQIQDIAQNIPTQIENVELVKQVVTAMNSSNPVLEIVSILAPLIANLSLLLVWGIADIIYGSVAKSNVEEMVYSAAA